ncbi:MAG: tetratricopeptide repeat protein [Magnetococcales bacterium]|nr:tetratricopeptide repeat protein [Magnetococcales bacterium]
MPETPFQRALRHHQEGRLEEAATAYRQAITEDESHLFSLTNLAIALHQLRRHAEAEIHCRRALRLDPQHAEAWNNLGLILVGLGNPEEAATAYRRCVTLEPDHFHAWNNLGLVLVQLNRIPEAIHAFEKTLALRPEHTQALMQLIHQKQHLWDWQGLDPLVQRLVEQMRRDTGEINPFSFLFLCHDAGQMRRCADRYARRVARQARQLPPVIHSPATGEDEPLRIGYLSGNFNQHPVAVLTRELFEAHDREGMRFFAYSHGPDDGSALRRSMERSFHRFHDCQGWSDGAIAQQMADDGLHILVELMGYTRNARSMVSALRPAPVQIAYLGYPGTMGGASMDYIVADPVVLPPEHRPHHAEQPICLSGCYQVNDSRRRVAAKTGTRAEHGLPESGVVFCCFNQSVKVTPEFFALWMDLLRRVPESCLWLMAFNPDVRKNAHRLAGRAGVAPQRLIFAPPLPLERHLARYRLADLFLDTLPYNAHTTASDALWVGCPVVTIPGGTFAGRVGASLLTTLGFPELIARDPGHYHRIALELATDTQRRLALRARLIRAVAGSELFSGVAFARQLETAFRAVWSRHRAGLPPAPLRVFGPGRACFEGDLMLTDKQFRTDSSKKYS